MRDTHVAHVMIAHAVELVGYAKRGLTHAHLYGSIALVVVVDGGVLDNVRQIEKARRRRRRLEPVGYVH